MAILAALFLLTRNRPSQEALEPTGVSIVYDSGATTQQTPHQAPIPTPAQTPPPPTPPVQTAETAPEVNLNVPENLLVPLPQYAPPAMPQAQPVHHTPPPPKRQKQKYMVMNDMSFGNASSAAKTGRKGLNLSLPQSNFQAANTPDLKIEGSVGADWEAGFNKWVYAHLYYPNAAAEQNQEGTVTVQFTAHRDGTVTGLHMISGSGSQFLDQAWFGIFAQNQLPPFPPGGSDTLKITAQVRYEILR